MLNNTLFLISFYAYSIALIIGILSAVNKKESIAKATFGAFFAAFLIHTVALFVRWGEAGNVEVAAFQEAEGRILQGWEWFQIWISHPPWSNLYESLVCFGWGLAIVSLYGIKKFQIRILPVFVIAMTLLIMGVASLLINKGITPLVPALQSKWIHLHVTMATISYPAFGLAAILGLLYLLKVGVKTETFGVVIAISAVLVILAVGGKPLMSEGSYEMALLTEHAGQTFKLTYEAEDTTGAMLTQSGVLTHKVPYVGGLLLLASLLSVLASAIYFFFMESTKFPSKKAFHYLMIGSFLALTAGLATVVIVTVFGAAPDITEATLKQIIESKHLSGGQTIVGSYLVHGNPPYLLSVKASPFEFMLLVMGWLGLVFYLMLSWKPANLVEQLPDAERLDELSYKTILFAFPFLTLLIITGAVWAYYAWGRYWGWDPKETWSLITWLIYSIYLHVRITHGWQGKIPAVLATLGFAIVIFTYLGVNILLAGLHSYATG